MVNLLNWLFINSLSFISAYFFQQDAFNVVFLLLILAVSSALFLVYLDINRPDRRELKEKRESMMDRSLQAFSIALVLLAFYRPVYLSLLPVALSYLTDWRNAWPTLCIFFPLLQHRPAPVSLFFFVFACLVAIWLAQLGDRYLHLRRKYYQTSDRAESNIRNLRQRNLLVSQSMEMNRRNDIRTERNRIAREIHDNVGHRLTSAILQVSALEMVSEDKEALAMVHETLDVAMNEIRASIHAMHDDSLSIENELEKLARSYQFCPIYLEVRYTVEPSSEIHYAILLTVREALANTAKHSNANRMDISLKQWGDNYNLIIADNGSLLPKKESDHGIGLLSMEERARSLKGSFHCNSQNGFHIFIQLPVDKEGKQ